MSNPAVLEEMFDVRGRVAVVTGAASGIGLAMATILADRGARVALLDHDAAGLAAAAGKLGGDVMTRAVDVSDAAAMTAAIDAVAAWGGGRIDIAFANAGIADQGFLEPEGRMANVDEGVWDSILGVNLTGVFNTVRLTTTYMKTNSWGRVIVTASIAGLKASPVSGYAYGATKAAVINLVARAAVELAPHNITVNAIAPGGFATNVNNGFLKDPEIRAAVSKDVPLGRIAEPEEMAGLALFLASPASGYLTGVVIPIDGGRTAG